MEKRTKSVKPSFAEEGRKRIGLSDNPGTIVGLPDGSLMIEVG